MERSGNPFRIGGFAVGYAFADREREVARIRRSLLEPGGKLLVYGRRRMGKSSAIVKAIGLLREEGAIVARADLSTPSNLVDMANVILREVSRAAGKRIGSFAADLLKRINLSISAKTEMATGLLLPTLDLNLRGEGLETQKAALAEVLDGIEAVTAAHNLTVGLVLDEFQEIHRFEGNFREWNLRAIIEAHQSVSYVLSGSRRHLIERMLDADRGFYRMFEKLVVEAIDADLLAEWIDTRMAENGVESDNAGTAIIALAGERSHDRMRLARTTFHLAQASGRADHETVRRAFEETVAEDRDEFHRQWEDLTASQQNILRALSMDVEALSSADTIRRFALKSTSSVSNTSRALIEKDLLYRQREPRAYCFDNPFFKAWVRRRTEMDLGLEPPA